MRSQQQADKEEQQRIKNLVLNYEKSTESDNDGNSDLERPLNRLLPVNWTPGIDKRSPPNRDSRIDKSGANRTAFRSRKLQLSDVNW